MVRLADPLYTGGQTSQGLVATFSPDGTKFLVVLRKGNLEQNTNEYSLLLWHTNDVSHSPIPDVVLTLSSSSNRQAIKSITWQDNESVAFLGEHPGEVQQIYTLNLNTRALRKLTDHSTSIVSYTATPKWNRVAFTAEGPVGSLFTESARREGIVVSTQLLVNLVTGITGGGEYYGGDRELFVKDQNSDSRRIEINDRIDPTGGNPSLSPNGRYLIVRTQVMDVPKTWEQYEDPLSLIKRSVRQKRPNGEPSALQRYELIDLDSGASQVLLNAPVGLSGSEVAWSPDSRSVALSGVYLPLNGIEGDERKLRQSNTFAVEVKIATGQISKISSEDLKLLTWDANTNLLVFQVRRFGAKDEAVTKVWFHRIGQKWEKVKDVAPELSRPNVILEEDMNTPPRIVVVDSTTHRTILLLNLNPQFRELKFAKVEEIEWRGSDGHDVKGGLYYPPGYQPNKRYPLVIQTHAWTPNKFWIDGPWTTAVAAQPLAGKGIMVLQAGESYADLDTPKEVQREVSALEGAIDYLSARGLIDRNRVGIVGFSRTCLFVKYALTHSKYHFSAAAVGDGIDGGYFQYVVFANAIPDFVYAFEGVNGGPPFGEGLLSWIRLSPGFSLDTVNTPLRIVANGKFALFEEWEWFSGLFRLHKPVEMIFMEDGTHILEKPWDRLVSQQGNVDWFCFWLKGEEDSDPSKVGQYVRWRELRKQQEAKYRPHDSLTANQ